MLGKNGLHKGPRGGRPAKSRVDALGRRIQVGPRGGLFVLTASGKRTRPAGVVAAPRRRRPVRPVVGGGGGGGAAKCRPLTRAEVVRAWPKNVKNPDWYLDRYDDPAGVMSRAVMRNPASILGPDVQQVDRELLKNLLTRRKSVTLLTGEVTGEVDVDPVWTPEDIREMRLTLAFESAAEFRRLKEERFAGNITADFSARFNVNVTDAIARKLIFVEVRGRSDEKWRPSWVGLGLYDGPGASGFEFDVFGSGRALFTWVTKC